MARGVEMSSLGEGQTVTGWKRAPADTTVHPSLFILIRSMLYFRVFIHALSEQLNTANVDDLGVRLRLVRQFIMNASNGDAARLLADPPQTTGSLRWDMFLCALGEYVSLLYGVPVPAWAKFESALDEWWFLMPYRQLHGSVLAETPPMFANRGVFIQRSSLINV